MDRHRLWRKVRFDREQLEEVAPTGYEPIVEVFLVGRQRPVEIGFVETSRREDDPWVRLQAIRREEGDEPDETRHTDEYWVHVHEGMIERVEIHFVRKGERETSFGLSYRNSEDESTEPESA